MTTTFTRIVLAVFVTVGVALLSLVPFFAFAAEPTLGGGHALVRGTTGAGNANTASNILSRMNFAATRGGQPAEVPPSSDETTEEETEDTEENTEENESNLPSQANENAQNNANGGASAGNGANGGNGGTAGEGGLVRAGSVVANATAVNAINTTIVRINNR